MLANGIRSMVDELITSTQFDDPYELGCKAFDSMTEEQKIWTLHKVAFGLLDEGTPVCELYAYLEATIAGIFRQLCRNISRSFSERGEWLIGIFEEPVAVCGQLYPKHTVAVFEGRTVGCRFALFSVDDADTQQ